MEHGIEGVIAKLKPCPFCGGKAYITSTFNMSHIDAFHTKKCLVRPNTWLISNKSLKKQVKAWNGRNNSI